MAPHATEPPFLCRTGQTDAVYAARQATLAITFQQTPERFVNKAATPPEKPTAAWINPPVPKSRA